MQLVAAEIFWDFVGELVSVLTAAGADLQCAGAQHVDHVRVRMHLVAVDALATSAELEEHAQRRNTQALLCTRLRDRLARYLQLTAERVHDGHAPPSGELREVGDSGRQRSFVCVVRSRRQQ